MSNESQSNLNGPVDSGGEPLDGSGFEDEQPEDGFDEEGDDGND